MPPAESSADAGDVPEIGHLLPMFLDPAVVTAVWERFCIPLQGVAARFLGSRVQGRVGPEDVVQSVYRTLYRRAKSAAAAAAGAPQPARPANPDDPDTLWKLLVTVTIRKAINKRVAHLRQKRSAAATLSGAGPDWAGAAAEPTPAEIAEQAETVANLKAALVGQFDHDLHKRIAAMVLDGARASEVAAAVGCVERTVYRVKREMEDAVAGILTAAELEDAT
jgi:DNA-directed RNA polymerase specialized sigma24 family protein